jgi:hypothetical protein
MKLKTLTILLVGVAVIFSGGAKCGQQQSQSGAMTLDGEGNIYARLGSGELIKMAGPHHCVEARGTVSQEMIACAVYDRSSANSEERLWSRRLEIYRLGGKVTVLETGDLIREWHFWNDGEQIEVVWDSHDAQPVHVLYETETGHVIEKVTEPSDARLLPQWAKDRSQIEDESVPMSPELAVERSRWVAKVLRQIGTIRPGMKRSDLLKVFTTEGGLSFRFQRTYVYPECRYIKVDVRFKSLQPHDKGREEDPGDIIESISKPYLEWSIVD